MWKGVALACALLALALAWNRSAWSCTSVRLKTEEGHVVYARTMEFANFPSALAVIPKGCKYQGTLPDGSCGGMKWTVKYGFVGMNVQGMPIVTDGINEKGLTMGSLYIPGYVEYQPFLPSRASSTMAQFEVNTWVLSSFATVAEVRKAIGSVRVCLATAVENVTPPLHFTVHDAAGESIVLEYVGGQLKVHDNPLGVLTNSPNFDWMIANLSNYVNLSPDNAEGMTVNGVKITPFSQGSGMLGLPGDFTSPSRFARMVALSQTPVPVKGSDAGVALAMTIINNVDIPVGAVRQQTPTGVELEITDWTVVADLARKRYFFRTYQNKNWRMVDVDKALANAKTFMTISIDAPADYPDVTGQATPAAR